jgi:hypothetical protein
MARDPGTDQPAPKKSNTFWWIIFGCGGLFVVVSLCASPYIVWRVFTYEETRREKAVESEAGTSVTAEDLTKEYDDNRGTADSKYKNKVLVVSGTVVVVETDRLSLAGTPPEEGRLKTSVHCYVPKKNQGQLTSLHEGDHVKVKGYFSADIVPIIKLEYCQIEK